jgi:Heterokaryon incompatibility protein (HET)
MKGIYQRSEGVIVWLGETDRSTKYVGELIDAVGSQPDGLHLCSATGDDEKLDALAKKIRPFIDLSNNPLSSGALRRKAIMNLLNQSWFQRVWVFQEVVVPKTVKMLVGDVTIHFRDLDNVMHAVWAVEYEGRGYIDSIAKTTVGFGTFAKMIHGRLDHASGEGSKDILGLLS